MHLADERLPVEPRLLERDQVAIAPDPTAQIEIPLESTVTVHGVVRKKATKKPVARVILAIRHGSRSLNRDVTTDANGRYEARVLPGKVNMQEIYSPLEDASQSNDSRSAEYDVPDDAVNFELPPIEVVKYHELKGRTALAKMDPRLRIRRSWHTWTRSGMACTKRIKKAISHGKCPRTACGSVTNSRCRPAAIRRRKNCPSRAKTRSFCG